MTARQENITTQRRRRDTDSLSGTRRKLAVTAKLDTENFAYRWANDEGNRLHDMTVNDDWDVVQDRSGTLKIDGAGTGAEVSVLAGVGEKGQGLRSVLLRKPRNLHDDDKRAEQRRIDETEAGMKEGTTSAAGQDARTYVPRGGITFG